MPKLKTHKGAKARFHVTGTGKLMRRKGNSSHLRRKKPKRVRRTFDHKLPVSKTSVNNLKRLMPNSF
jgi:large subunit ribosomal protein L35